MTKRLQVYLSHAGVASRRKAADVIASGRVTVNGNIVTERGAPVDPGSDVIALDGKRIRTETHVYVVLNKPKGYVTTLSDEKGRRTVMDLLPHSKTRLYPVGRLDKDTEGLLLLTNDGELANRLTHPRFGVKKIYSAEVSGEMKPEQIKRLENGIFIEGKRTAPCKIHLLKSGHGFSILRFELHEGRKRQIRCMVRSTGAKVKKLKRISYGGITLKGLPEGACRELTSAETEKLKEMTGL